MKIVINGKNYELSEKTTILQACRDNNIFIPTLCHNKHLSASGGCRLCIVKIQGVDKPQTSCSTYAEEGMVIETHSEELEEIRHNIIDLLYSNHPEDCLTCAKSGECGLQDLCYQYGVPIGSYRDQDHKDLCPDASNKFFDYDSSKCIQCGLCVRTCKERQGAEAMNFQGRGFDMTVGAGPLGLGDRRTNCVSCGNCVSVCPTGALQQKKRQSDIPYRYWEVEKVQTTCSYCGVGCQLNLLVKDGYVVEAQPIDALPNEGMLCVKGKFAYRFINHPDRLSQPLVKRNGVFEEVSWEEAYRVIKEKYDAIMGQYGPSAFAGISSARCTDEDNYLFQKLVRTVFHNHNVDHCARLCHASTVSGLNITLGSGAMTNSIRVTEDSEANFIIGSNTTETHPVLGAKIRKSVRERGNKLIVADPRRIDIAKDADVFLQIEPGTNVALANGMMHIIIAENLHDMDYIEDHTENFEELKKVLEAYTPEVVAEICGIKEEDLIKAARIFGQAETASIYYTMGVTQHTTGTNGVMSLSNLALITGNIGREYAGINPLRGQNNVQGACDMGALPTFYPDYQKVGDELADQRYSDAWQVPMSQDPGLSLTEMFDQAAKGRVKFMYIMGENPMVSDPDLKHIEEGLETCDFVIVQDIFMNETAEYADVILPAASFAEKEGTFTNTERKVQLLRRAVEPIGNTKPDWQIIMELSNLLGYPEYYSSASDVYDEMTSLADSHAGISHQRMEKEGHGLAWPCTSPDDPGTLILHQGEIKKGKGTLMPIDYTPSNEQADEEYPFLMTTGRILYHYHTRTMTDKTEGLNEIADSSYIEMNPVTARNLNIADGDTVKVRSRRGEIETTARITDIIDDNIVFMPFHFSDGLVNTLTSSDVDPIAKIPELKVTAVNVEKA